MADQPDICSIKCVVVGKFCGKTNAIVRYTTGDWKGTYEPTVFDIRPKLTTVNNEQVKLEIWDLGGSDENKKVRICALENSNVAIIAFNLASRQTLEYVVYGYYPEIRSHLPDVPIVLAGMQLDRTTKDLSLIHI